MSDVAQRLREARDALHRLQIGEAAVEVRDSDGSMVRYSMANASRLEAYVKRLEGEAAGRLGAVRPFRVTFG